MRVVCVRERAFFLCESSERNYFKYKHTAAAINIARQNIHNLGQQRKEMANGLRTEEKKTLI